MYIIVAKVPHIYVSFFELNSRHRCPHRPKAPRAIGPCTITEYTAKYPAHPTNGLRKSFKPNEDIVRGTGPLSDQTTNR